MRRSRPRRRARSLALLLAGTLFALAATPAFGGDDGRGSDEPRVVDTFPVAPGLVREEVSWQTLGGPQKIQVLRFGLDDPRLELDVELATGRVPGLESVRGAVRRLGDEAVAAVNGGFWLDSPTGDPEGFTVVDGRYVSEPATRGHGPRGAFALFADAEWSVARPEHVSRLWLPDGTEVPLFLNREPSTDRAGLFTSAFGPRTAAPATAVEVVLPGVEPRPTQVESVEVGEVRSGGGPIPTDAVVVSGTGELGDDLEQLSPGDVVSLDLALSEPWNDAVEGLTAGPLLLRDGQPTRRDSWADEGFEHPVHNDRAHPRSLLGVTADGEAMLITVDGRQPDRSVGLTTQESQSLLRQLGAEDALMLDGGGSTTMVVDGRVENVPCCGVRPVAYSLVVRARPEHPDVTRLAGADRFATAAAVARSGWPDGTRSALLASGTEFPDGLAGGVLGAVRDLPLLLTRSDNLPGATVEALDDLDVRRVTVLGGTAAVEEPVVRRLEEDLGLEVQRLAGPDRAATAAAIARRVGAGTGRALLASGRAFADALTATGPAVRARGPVLLTEPDRLPDATLAALRDLRVRQVVVAGGPAVVDDAVLETLRDEGFTVTRVAGANRYATAAALVRWAEQTFGWQPPGVALAAARKFPDALAVAPYAGREGLAVLLSGPYSLGRHPATDRWISGHSLDRAVLVGGRTLLGTWVAHELQRAVR